MCLEIMETWKDVKNVSDLSFFQDPDSFSKFDHMFFFNSPDKSLIAGRNLSFTKNIEQAR